MLTESKLKSAFTMFDKDGSGLIDFDEIKLLFKKLPERLIDKIIQ
jgi:Ca2+-binding EF-hand superfamily protein